MIRIVALVLLVACSGGKRLDGVMDPKQVAPKDPLAAFEVVRAVFQSPRCQNCHPAGEAPLQGDEGRVHNQNVQRGPTGNGMVGAECTTCHRDQNPPDSFGVHTPPGFAKGWHMPPPELKMVFVGLTPNQLCEQIKDPARNGGKDAAALRAHLDDPLVLWAWTPGFGRKPPPHTHAALVAAWESWAAGGSPCPN
jgi:hypothetical protein